MSSRPEKVRSAQRLVQAAGRGAQLAPVEPGLAVGGRLAVDEHLHGCHAQSPGFDGGEAVPPEDRLGLLVAALPHVRVVRVDRLVGGQAYQRPPRQVIERL